VVWTDAELLYWGGSTDYEADFHGEGAAFDPAARTWRETPATPLTSRAYADVVWTGSEIIIWGGRDGSGGLERRCCI
jgi:hypothetical protein